MTRSFVASHRTTSGYYSNYLDFHGAPISQKNHYDFRRIEKYIVEHAEENISIDELASISGLSKFHFLRLFKKNNGITPYQFVLARELGHSGKCF